MNYVPFYVEKLLNKINPSLSTLYLRYPSFFNYALVCGIGMVINQIILYATYGTFPLWVANFYGIFCAWAWNWTNSVGTFGHIWGLGSKKPLYTYCPECGKDLKVK